MPCNAEVGGGRLSCDCGAAEEFASFAGETVQRVDWRGRAGTSSRSDVPVRELLCPSLHFAFDLGTRASPRATSKFPPDVHDHAVQKLDQVEQQEIQPEFGRKNACLERVVAGNITCMSLDRGRDETPGKNSPRPIRQPFQPTEFLGPDLAAPNMRWRPCMATS